MKGIILAGGNGTRLYPTTVAINKQLLPVYDKPMIYYPLGTLMGAGITEILIITTRRDLDLFKTLLKDGSQLGCSFTYAIQDKPIGIADSFVVGKDFVANDNVALILGDNIFHGSAMGYKLAEYTQPDGCIIFGYKVSKPSQYGIVEFDQDKKVISIEEKPTKPKSSYAIPGLYFFDNKVLKYAESVTPSLRGEKEITDILKYYLEDKALQIIPLGRGTAWLDTGTFNGLNQASTFVEVIEERQGVKIGCIEEIAYLKGLIDSDQLKQLAKPLLNSGYGEYLLKVASFTGSTYL